MSILFRLAVARLISHSKQKWADFDLTLSALTRIKSVFLDQIIDYDFRH